MLDHLVVGQHRIEDSIRYFHLNRQQDSPLSTQNPRSDKPPQPPLPQQLSDALGYLHLMRRLALCISVSRVHDSTSMLLVYCQYYEGTIIPTGHWEAQ
jgi:hypothetical protein